MEVELKDEGDEVSTTIEAHDQSVPMLIPIRTLPMAWRLFTHSDMNEDVEPSEHATHSVHASHGALLFNLAAMSSGVQSTTSNMLL